ncbi:hypothetical protein MRX96_018099 [Rhipicephalus microplus]
MKTGYLRLDVHISVTVDRGCRSKRRKVGYRIRPLDIQHRRLLILHIGPRDAKQDFHKINGWVYLTLLR